MKDRIGGPATGEYFHALEDTFSHSKGRTDRDWKYRGGENGGIIGHALDGHSADWTWKYEEKSMKMAEELFYRMMEYATAQGIFLCPVTKWEDIQPTVLSFVKHRPSRVLAPILTVTFEGYNEKIKKLDLGYSLPIIPYKKKMPSSVGPRPPTGPRR